MGLTKTAIFTSEQNDIALIGKALGHPARIAILEYLFKIENCFCGDLVEEIGLAQATVSQHLKELKKVGLIKGNVEGASVCYCIDLEKWELIKDVMMRFLDQDISQKNDCC
jgi:DNA-binding transcriptional ArsR family regulator